MLQKKKLFCVVGETCSDKNTIIDKVVHDSPEIFKQICSYTTRPKRDGEVDGVDHYFLTPEKFEEIRHARRKEILAYTKIASKESDPGYEYMTLFSELYTGNIYTIDPNGLDYLKTHFGDKLDIVTIYIYAPYETRAYRATHIRHDDLKAFSERVKSEHAQFDVFRNYKDYDYILYNFNGQLDSCVSAFKAIANYELNERDISGETIISDDLLIRKRELSEALGFVKDMMVFYQTEFPNKYSEARYLHYIKTIKLTILNALSQL